MQRKKRIKALILSILMLFTYMIQPFIGIGIVKAEDKLPEPYKYWGIAISAVVDISNGGSMQNIIEGRNLKDIEGIPTNNIYGKDLNATLVTDVSVPKEYVIDGLDSIMAFDDYRTGSYPETENKDSDWKEDKSLIWITHMDAMPKLSAGLPFTMNKPLGDGKSFDITINVPSKESMMKTDYTDRYGTTDGTERKYNTTLSFVLVAHHEKFDPETGEWDIESKVSADLKMSEESPATFNYKDFDENTETSYGVNMDASGSSSARPNATYTYDMGVKEADGNVDYKNEKTSDKNQIILNGDVLPEEIYSKDYKGKKSATGTFRVDGTVTVEDDKAVSATAYANTDVGFEIVNEKPTAIYKATDKATSSDKYLYAKRSVVIKDQSLDPENNLMDSDFSLFDGTKKIANWTFKKDKVDGTWTVVSSDKLDEYIEDMSLNASSLENTLTFKKSGNFKLEHRVGDIRNHEIVEQKTDTRNSILNIRSAAAPPKADFEYRLNGKVTDYTYPNVEVSLLDKSTDPNDDIVKWEWTKYNGTKHDGQNGATAVFTSEGTYNTSLKVTDFLGLTDSITKPIQVLPPIPKAEIVTNDDESLMKKNRRIIISSEESFAPPSDPIQWDKTAWKIEPLDGQNPLSIKISNSLSDTKKKAVVFKETGRYKATIDLENNYTQANPNHPRISLKTTSIVIEIKDDIKPEPKFEITGNAPNFKDNPVSTTAKVANTSSSPDNDYLDIFPDLNLDDPNNYYGRGKNAFEMEIRKDKNEDGIFSDSEVYGKYTTRSVDIPVNFKANEGSDYQATLKIKETFGQPTIKEFVSEDDRVTNTLVKEFSINWIPFIEFDLPDWAYPDDEIAVKTNIKDERVDTTKVVWTVDKKNADGSYTNLLIDSDTINTLLKEGGKIRFPESGFYKLTSEITDEKGQKSSHSEEIRIYPFPTAVISDNPLYRFDNTDNPQEFNSKQNRTYELSGQTSHINDYFGTGIHQIDHSKDYFEIIPLDGQSVDSIKVTNGLFTLNSEDGSIFKATNTKLDREMLFKSSGSYKVRYQVTNVYGKKSPMAEQTIFIFKDEEPVSTFELEQIIYRDPNNSNKARISAYNIKIYSPDKDNISLERVRYKFDSNNNKSFDDEVWQNASSIDKSDPYNWKVEVLGNKVGKYQLEIYSEETFGQPTIDKYITAEDKRKKSSIKNLEVDNKAPLADFSTISQDKVDIVYLVGNTEFTDSSKLNTKIDSIVRETVGSHFGSSVDVSVLKKVNYLNKSTMDNLIKDVTWRENSTRVIVAYDDSGSLLGYDELGNLNSAAYLNILKILESKNIHLLAFGDAQKVKSKFEKIIFDNNKKGMYIPFTCKQSWDFTSNSTFTVPTYGEYQIETWGKQGRSFYMPYFWWGEGTNYEHVYGGKGSYATGTKIFNKGEILYPRFDFSADVRTNPSDLYSRIVVAGGGGDASAKDEKDISFYEGKIIPYEDGFPGDVGETRINKSPRQAQAGYETGGGVGGWYPNTSSRYDAYPGLTGEFGKGADPRTYSKDLGGGGGDGWYGGGSGCLIMQRFVGYSTPELQPDGSILWVDNNRGGGYYYNTKGAGGSSHIDNSLNNRIIKKGNEYAKQPSGIMDWGHAGEGYVRITKLLGADDTDAILKSFANYIIQKTVISKPSKTNISYILVNEKMDYKVHYSDYENDPQMNIHNWKYDHDPYFFENSLGQIANSNVWLNGSIDVFDKTGKYLVEYRTKDNPVGSDDRFDEYRKYSTMPNGPMELFVHRKPIAKAKVNITKNATNITATLNSQGFDLDHQSEPSKGIRAYEWSYKEVGGTTWINGGNSTSFILNGSVTKDYLVKHRVQDIDGENGIGVWSDDNIILVTAKSMPPIADFEVTSVYPLRSNLSVTDYSYDPNGDTLVEYRWKLSKGTTVHLTPILSNNSGVTQAQVNTIATAVKNKIDSLGNTAYGLWTLELQVRDSSGTWGNPLSTSEPTTRTILVVPNNSPPVVNINPNHIFVDGRNDFDTDNLSNPLNTFEKWNVSVSDPDVDNKGFVYRWEIEHHSDSNGKMLKNASEMTNNDTVVTKIYTTKMPFENETFIKNNLAAGAYKARLKVTDIPTFGAAKTVEVVKNFYVVPEMELTSMVKSEKDEILCGDTVTLTASSDIYTKSVTAEILGKEVSLSEASRDENKIYWEAPFTIPEIDESKEVEITFESRTDYGSKDVFGTDGKTTRIDSCRSFISVTALKLEDFRVIDLVCHPEYKDLYPLRRDSFTLNYIAGYYCTFNIDAKGNPEKVFAKVKHNGADVSTVELKKIGTNGNIGIWEGKYFAPFDTPKNTVISFELEATKNISSYNYNEKESWSGDTLKIVASLLKDAVISRTN